MTNVLRNEDDMLDHYVSILEKAADEPTNLMLLSVVAQGLRLCRPFKAEAAKYKRVILNVAFGAARGTFYVHIPISLPPYDGVSPSMTRGPVRIYKSQLGQTPVVAKDLHLGNKQDQENAQLYLALASILSHPNLLPSLGADLTPTVLRTASALCASGNLREFISVQPQRRDEALQTQIINETIAGLRYLHASGVVHANLKPENVLIWCPRPSAAGSLVTLTDYGTRASSGAAPEFRAPEVLNGAVATEASDIFSLGQIIWMVLAWRAPEAANPSPAELKEIQKRVMEGKLQPIPPEWPAHYRRMIRNCRSDARDRPSASDLVLIQLETVLEKERAMRKQAEQGLAKATEKITELESELKFAKLGKRMRAGSVPASPDKQGGGSSNGGGEQPEPNGEAQLARLGVHLGKMKAKLHEWRLSEQTLAEQLKPK